MNVPLQGLYAKVPRHCAETYVQKEQVYTDSEPEIVAQCKHPGRCKSCRRTNQQSIGREM